MISMRYELLSYEARRSNRELNFSHSAKVAGSQLRIT